MKTPQASEKIELARHLSGEQIIQLVKQIVGNDQRDPREPTFYKVRRDKLGFAFSVGQTSGYRSQHLLVMPARKSRVIYADYFGIREDYTSIEVVSQYLPSWQLSPQKLFQAQFTEAEIKEAVRNFAQKLRQNSMVR